MFTVLGFIAGVMLTWPFSIIDSLVFDIIDGIQILVKKVFHGVYNKIYESAISALK